MTCCGESHAYLTSCPPIDVLIEGGVSSKKRVKTSDLIDTPRVHWVSISLTNGTSLVIGAVLINIGIHCTCKGLGPATTVKVIGKASVKCLIKQVHLGWILAKQISNSLENIIYQSINQEEEDFHIPLVLRLEILRHKPDTKAHQQMWGLLCQYSQNLQRCWRNCSHCYSGSQNYCKGSG